MKKAIPKEWLKLLRSDESNKSIVNVCKDKTLLSNNFIEVSVLSNKKLCKIVKFDMQISLRHLDFGYTISDKNCFPFNYFTNLVGYSIYKA